MSPKSHYTRTAAIAFVAGVLLHWGCHAEAQKPVGDLPEAQQPWLAEEGDWAADFNQAQMACYEGSMKACDSIWSNERVLMDTFLYKYGRTCGGRVDLHEIVQANLTCIEAFPGHE